MCLNINNYFGVFCKEQFYDPTAKLGFIEMYVRQRRSRSNSIETLGTAQRKRSRYVFVWLSVT